MNLCIQNGGLTGHFPTGELYKHVAEAGFSSIDLNIDNAISRNVLLYHRNEGLTIYEKSLPEIIEYFRPEVDAIKAAGLYVYQAHAPFPPCVVKEDVTTLDYSIEIYKKCILFCQEIGCYRLIIHGVKSN